jgi:hypothetical protein
MIRPELKNPAVAPTTDGAQVGGLVLQPGPRPITQAGTVKRIMRVRLPDGSVPTIGGREAQTLALLIRKGSRGFTSGEASVVGWARRTSAYVHNLRRLGVPIATEREKTTDGATVARYTLAAPIAVVSDCDSGEGVAKTE